MEYPASNALQPLKIVEVFFYLSLLKIFASLFDFHQIMHDANSTSVIYTPFGANVLTRFRRHSRLNLAFSIGKRRTG